MINNINNNFYQIQPPSHVGLVTPAMKNELQARSQVNLDEAVTTLKGNKNQQWHLMLVQSHVNTQFLNEYIQAKDESLPKVGSPIHIDELVMIKPASYEDNAKIQRYISIQRTTDSSLLHISA